MAMHDASQLRILVAGAGGFAREHLDRLAGRGDVRLAGIAVPDPAVLALAAGRYSIKPCLSDPLRLIDETPADALIVATPLASHVEITTRALARNLCELLEKPVGATAAIARQVLRVLCHQRTVARIPASRSLSGCPRHHRPLRSGSLSVGIGLRRGVGVCLVSPNHPLAWSQ